MFFKLQKYQQFFFLSPHLDDAILSCGSLITKLITLKKKVTVITVFTKVTKRPYSDVAEDLLIKCGFDDAEKLFEERKKEDILVMKKLGCIYIHLDFVDAAWRKTKVYNNYLFLRQLIKHIPQLVHVYPDGNKQFSGNPSHSDLHLIDDINNRLYEYIYKVNKTLVFAPLGVGGHADHVLVREAAGRISKKVIFWEDFPYSIKLVDNNNRINRFDNSFKLAFQYDKNQKKKISIIKMYKSQMNALFPDNKMHITSEKYYT